MSTSIKTKDSDKEDKENELITELYEHLSQMGIKAAVVESGSPENVGGLVTFALGCVKIEGRNIDLVQVERGSVAALQPKLQPGVSGYTREKGQGSTRYDYHYVVRANVAGLESKLEAEFTPIEKRKGLFGKEVVGFQWKGGYLAQLLDGDSVLKDMLLKEGFQGLTIKPEKEHQCVRITPPTGALTSARFDFDQHHPLVVGRKAFPTQGAFEVYDRIAQCIRGITSAQA